MQYALWTGTVWYVALLKMDGLTDDQLDELEDDDEVKSQARLIYETLLAHLRPHVKEGWFRERVGWLQYLPFAISLSILKQFREGVKSIRSNQVYTLAKLFPTYIFSSLPAEFSDKAKCCDLPEIAALLLNKRFLYDREPSSPQAALDGHLRNPCILKVRSIFGFVFDVIWLISPRSL